MFYQGAFANKTHFIIATLLCLIVLSCNSTNPTTPDTEVSFTIDNIQNSILNPMDTVVINGKFDGFNDSTFVVRAGGQSLCVLAYSSDKIIVVAPIHGSSSNRTFEITITKTDSTLVSNNKSISVAALPAKYSTAGQYALEIANRGLNISKTIMAVVAKNKNYLPTGKDSATAIADLQREFTKIDNIYNGAKTEITGMTQEDKRILDGILILIDADSLMSAVHLPGSLMKRTVSAGATDYPEFYGLVSLDIISGFLTAAKTGMGLGKIVAIFSGAGVAVAPVMIYFEIALDAADHVIDGCFPTDIDSVWVQFPLNQNSQIYQNAEYSVEHWGKFVSQSNPATSFTNYTLNFIVNVAVETIASNNPAFTQVAQNIANAVVTKIISFTGVTGNGQFINLDSGWKISSKRELKVDPGYYLSDLTTVITNVSAIAGVEIELPGWLEKLFAFVKSTPATTTNISVSSDLSTITTTGSGQASVNYYPFACKSNQVNIDNTNAFTKIYSFVKRVATTIVALDLPKRINEPRALFTISSTLAFNGSIILNQLSLSSHPINRLYVSIVDTAGNPVTSVSSSGLALTEDNKSCSISSVSPVNSSGTGANTDYVLILDNSTSLTLADIQSIDSAAAYFATKLSTGSRVAVVRFAADIQPLGGGRFVNNQAGMVSLLSQPYSGAGGTALWDAVLSGATLLSSSTSKRVVVVFTDGLNNVGTTVLSEVIASLQAANTTCYTIGSGTSINVTDLTSLAVSNGGIYYPFAGTGLGGVFDQIIKSEANQYLIRYSSVTTLDNQNHVVGISYLGKSASRSFEYDIKPTSAPSAVTLNTIQDITDSTCKLVWSQSSDPYFCAYRIYRSTTSTVDTSCSLVSIVLRNTISFFTDTRLTKGQIYYYRVYVYNTAGMNIGSYTESADIGGPDPTPAALLAVDSTGETTARIRWTLSVVSDFYSYSIYYATDSLVDSMDILAVTKTSTLDTVYNVTSLSRNTKYWFRVYVEDVDGYSAGSNRLSATTKTGLPDTVTLATPDSVTDVSLKLMWTKSVAKDFYRYIVYMDSVSASVDTNDRQLVLKTLVSDTMYKVTGLSRSKQYWFKVFVKDSSGLVSGSAVVSATTQSGIPDTVTLATPDSVTDISLKLTWTKCKANDFYRYIVCMDSNSSSVDTNDIQLVLKSLASDTAYWVTGLSRSKQYWFRVFVKDSSGFVSGSAVTMATTQSGIPQAVVVQTPVVLSATSMRIRWSRCTESDFASYRLYYSSTSTVDTNSTFARNTTTRTDTSFIVTGLMDTTQYWFKVYVYDNGNLNAASSSVSAKTLNAAPAPVIILSPTNITPNSITITWNKSQVNDFARYRLYYTQSSKLDTVDTNSTLVRSTTTITDTSYTITGLKENTYYDFAIYVSDQSDLISPKSNIMQVETGNAPPASVLLLPPENVTAKSLTVRWHLSVDTDFNQYLLYCNIGTTVDSTDSLILSSSRQIDTSLIVNYMKEGTQYSFVMYVVDDGGLVSSASNIIQKYPSILTIDRKTETSTTLSWTQSTGSGFAAYKIFKSNSSGVTNLSDLVTTITSKTDTSFTETGLNSQTRYYYCLYCYEGLSAGVPSNEVNVVTLGNGSLSDIQGNVYNTITIGNQVWMVENLRTTAYNDDSAISLVTDNTTWSTLTTPAYCYQMNTTNTDTINKYGALYNWYAVNTGKLAPVGWHVPTNAEWDTLKDYLIANGYNWDITTTGNKIAKSMAAKSDWAANTNIGAVGNDLTTNNRSGFSALPSGYRYSLISGGVNGKFSGTGFYGYWWSATANDSTYAGEVNIDSYNDYLSRNNGNKAEGFSVRLVKD